MACRISRSEPTRQLPRPPQPRSSATIGDGGLPPAELASLPGFVLPILPAARPPCTLPAPRRVRVRLDLHRCLPWFPPSLPHDSLSQLLLENLPRSKHSGPHC